MYLCYLHTEPFLSSPDKLYISKVGFHSNRLTFYWNSTVTDCSTVQYKILASNCGSCPTATNHTTVTCTDVPNNDVCVFMVSTVVCENIITNQSGVINVTLDTIVHQKGIFLKQVC